MEAALAQKGKENQDLATTVATQKTTIGELEKEIQKSVQELAQLTEKTKRDLEKAKDERSGKKKKK